MKAFLIHLNGRKHCLAGLQAGGVEVSVGLTEERADGPYSVAVYGVDLETEHVSLWPSANLQVGDELKIVVVEADIVDPPDS